MANRDLVIHRMLFGFLAGALGSCASTSPGRTPASVNRAPAAIDEGAVDTAWELLKSRRYADYQSFFAAQRGDTRFTMFKELALYVFRDGGEEARTFLSTLIANADTEQLDAMIVAFGDEQMPELVESRIDVVKRILVWRGEAEETRKMHDRIYYLFRYYQRNSTSSGDGYRIFQFYVQNADPKYVSLAATALGLADFNWQSTIRQMIERAEPSTLGHVAEEWHRLPRAVYSWDEELDLLLRRGGNDALKSLPYVAMGRNPRTVELMRSAIERLSPSELLDMIGDNGFIQMTDTWIEEFRYLLSTRDDPELLAGLRQAYSGSTLDRYPHTESIRELLRMNTLAERRQLVQKLSAPTAMAKPRPGFFSRCVSAVKWVLKGQAP